MPIQVDNIAYEDVQILIKTWNKNQKKEKNRLNKLKRKNRKKW